MNFSYQAYVDMLALLKEGGYRFCDYHTYAGQSRCAILRHDIDTSLEQALRLAELEAAQGVRSTWFVLLRTDFYNVFSLAGRRALQKLLALGHNVGLHFDEAAYGRPLSAEEIVRNIQEECGILSTVLERPVTCVSMHRPSQMTLEADLQIPGVVNSYGKTFFRDFKYLSDSRRRWREPVLDIIRAGEYDRLHILTHAFWYHEQEETIAETVGDFVRAANGARYAQMKDNITDLESILGEDEI